MTASDFTAWMQRNGLTVRGAAAVLGCATLTVDRYKNGRAVIPRYMALACAAVEAGLLNKNPDC
jgi:plasmid maintenance system antidote protein VapI